MAATEELWMPTTMIEAIHNGMMANVSIGVEVSESFSVTNGVKQSYVLALTLFSIFLLGVIPLHNGCKQFTC